MDDRNGDSLTLRPEGTAGCVRSCIQTAFINRDEQRLWYMGPMFRHERPPKAPATVNSTNVVWKCLA